MGWTLIGKVTVLILAYGVIYGILRGFELLAGDDGLRGLYRGIVHLECAMALSWVIFAEHRWTGSR